MIRTLAAALFASTIAFAAPAALACGGDSAKTAQATPGSSADTTVVASQKEKAPAAKKDATVEKTTDKAADKTPFKMLAVDDVAKGLDAAKVKKDAAYAVFDANGKGTREKMGIIPTSVLLDSSAEYDLALLPKDKASPVVFYCANERCTASHTAAKRAIKAGHSDVGVLASGIKGWVDAGKAVDKPVG